MECGIEKRYSTAVVAQNDCRCEGQKTKSRAKVLRIMQCLSREAVDTGSAIAAGSINAKI